MDHTPNKTQKCPAGTRKGNAVVGCMNREKAKQPFLLHLALRRLHGGLHPGWGTTLQPACGSTGERAETSTKAD